MVAGDGGDEDFGLLQQRIHPAASRVELLAERDPRPLRRLRPAGARRTRRCSRRPSPSAARGAGGRRAGPRAGGDVDRPRPRARSGCATSEGVIAKRLDAPYRPGERQGMVKIKRVRTIDCVVIGWRPGHDPGHRRLADPRPLRRRRRCGPVGHCAGFTGEAQAGAARRAGAPTRPAGAAAATPAAGAPAASWSGSSCGPSWWPRSATTTPAAGASATARACCASGTTATRELHGRPARGVSAAYAGAEWTDLFVATAGAARRAGRAAVRGGLDQRRAHPGASRGSRSGRSRRCSSWSARSWSAVLCLPPVEPEALGWLPARGGRRPARHRRRAGADRIAQPPRPLDEGRDRPGTLALIAQRRPCCRLAGDQPARGGGRRPLLGRSAASSARS